MKNLSLNFLPNQNFPCPWNGPGVRFGHAEQPLGWLFSRKKQIKFSRNQGKFRFPTVTVVPMKTTTLEPIRYWFVLAALPFFFLTKPPPHKK